MGISGNMQSLSQLCACYGVPRVTRGFTTLFIGETFAVYGILDQYSWMSGIPRHI
jgi:hypothetical protein